MKLDISSVSAPQLVVTLAEAQIFMGKLQAAINDARSPSFSTGWLDMSCSTEKTVGKTRTNASVFRLQVLKD